jgi:hypothetical protein
MINRGIPVHIHEHRMCSSSLLVKYMIDYAELRCSIEEIITLPESLAYTRNCHGPSGKETV